MYLAFICESSAILKVLRIVKIVVTFLRIVIPIILIISIMIGFSKHVKDGDDGKLQEEIKKSVKKAIAAVCVFLIPTFINIVLSIVNPDNNYVECMKNATSEKIQEAEYNEVDKLVSTAEEYMTYATYYQAKNEVKKIKDKDLRDEFTSRLEVVESVLDVKSLVTKAGDELDEKSYEKAREAVEKLDDSELKTQLLNELDEIKSKLPSSVQIEQISCDGTTILKGKSLEELLIEKGSSVDELNNKIKKSVTSAGVGTRKAVVNAAVTLINEVKSLGYLLPYRWGGKAEIVGINSSWGKNIGSPGNICDSHPNPNKCKTQHLYSGLDCTGFVAWAFVNGFQSNTKVSQQKITNIVAAKEVSLSGKTSAICKAGDVLDTPDHRVLVIGLDDENKRYIIAESSCAVHTGYVSYNNSSYTCTNMDSLYNN